MSSLFYKCNHLVFQINITAIIAFVFLSLPNTNYKVTIDLFLLILEFLIFKIIFSKYDEHY